MSTRAIPSRTSRPGATCHASRHTRRAGPRRRVLRGLPVTCAVLTGAVVAATVLFAPASLAQRDLIDATPAEVVLVAPAPGESQSWTMAVNSTTDATVPLALEITGQSDRLFTGDHPLQITIVDTAGETVLERTDVADVVGTSLGLADLPAGASRQLAGTVTLPREAGNAYQGAGGELRLRFVAQADERAEPPVVGVHLPALPVTGAPAFLGAAAVLAAVAIVSGLVLVRRSAKRANHA